MSDPSAAEPPPSPPPPGDFAASMARMTYAMTRQHAMAGSKDPAADQLALRRELDPEPGDPRAVQQACAECGVSFWRWAKRWRKYCPECAADRLRRNLENQRTRTGPNYSKYVDRQLAYYRSERQRLDRDEEGRATG